MAQSSSEFLKATFRKESRSLLQYVSEAYPWTLHPESAPLRTVLHFAKSELVALAQLGKAMMKARMGLPLPGAYPQSFTTLNFIALDFLGPMLVADQKRCLAELDEGLNWLPPGDTRHALEHLVDLKRKHLEKLESMQPA